MKTNLNRKIETIEDAKQFLSELFNNDEAYHPEDNANDIEFKTAKVSAQEREALNPLMNDCFIKGFDPCEYLLDLINDQTN